MEMSGALIDFQGKPASPSPAHDISHASDSSRSGVQDLRDGHK